MGKKRSEPTLTMVIKVCERIQLIGGGGSGSTENQGERAARSYFFLIIAQWSALRQDLAALSSAIDAFNSKRCEKSPWPAEAREDFANLSNSWAN